MTQISKMFQSLFFFIYFFIHKCVEKHTGKQVTHLHDVGLVNSSDFAPAFFGSIIKGELGDAA